MEKEQYKYILQSCVQIKCEKQINTKWICVIKRVMIFIEELNFFNMYSSICITFYIENCNQVNYYLEF